MSTDPQRPAITSIYLDNGDVEVFAHSPPDPSITPSSTSLPSSTSSLAPSDLHGKPGHPNLYVPSLRTSTVTSTPTPTITPSQSPDVASSNGTINIQAFHGLVLVAVIALPILLLMIVSSMVFLCCRARQQRKTRCSRGEQGKSHGTSMFASLKSPSKENHKTPGVQHSAYFPAVTVSRDPSPTPETRSRANPQSSDPQPGNTVGSDPPPPYVLQSDSLRPPSMYGRVHTRSLSPTLSEANLSIHDDATLRSPFGSPYLDVESDALSDVSYEPGYSLRRQRDADEVSFVSSLEPEEHVERDLHYIV